jgi:D-alanine-D-alanine ligase
MNKLSVIIAMGGPSQEREISLKTGLEIFRHIDRTRYAVSLMLISEDKKFFYAREPDDISETDLLKGPESELFRGPFSPEGAVSIWNRCDICFNALHGEFGEDGVFQGYLETIGTPYTGCSVLSSAVGMHKTLAKKIFEASGIPTPPYSVYRNEPEKIEYIGAKHGFPCFVKCPQSGSSKLMELVHSPRKLEQVLNAFSQEAESVLVETYLSGDEFSCPVLEIDGKAEALPPVYIKPREGHYFDYDAKYKGESEEIVPAPHSQELLELIQKTALAVHTSLECRILSRTDIIIHRNVPYVLEVNTLPGFTSQSLFPKSFKARGGTFTELIDLIIAGSIKK